MIKVIQGYEFKLYVNTSSSFIVIKGDDSKIVINNVEEEGGHYYITAPAEVTAQWKAGSFKYQILNNDGIEDEGIFVVLINYALTDEYTSVKSQNEMLLEAIEAQIAGKATAAQQSMSVGDKSISYCTINELFTLRDYFKKKVAEEQGIQNVEGNELKIKYKWGFR